LDEVNSTQLQANNKPITIKWMKKYYHEQKQMRTSIINKEMSKQMHLALVDVDV